MPDSKHLNHFDNGIVLLDRNIQYLLHLHGHQLYKGSNNGSILGIAPLFDLSLAPTKHLGRKLTILPKIKPVDEDDVDDFSILKLTKVPEPIN